MKTVVSYLSGIPSRSKNSHKTELLKRFAEGVIKCGDTGIIHTGENLIDADAAVIQGWVHSGSPNTPHLRLRKQVAQSQLSKNKRTIIIDSNLFNYKNKNDNLRYHRFSLDGVFPTTGNYMWDEVDNNRWKQISRDLGITLKDWRTEGDHILICTQRNGGWSMQGVDVVSWVLQTIKKIRQYTTRPIIVRGHPGDKHARRYLNIKTKDFRVSTNEHISDDFKNAWAVVVYNSTPGVAATIEGIPAFITDPNPRISQAFGVANTNLSLIENPNVFERQDWIERLSMCHWNFNELSNGTAWKHMRKYI